MDSESQRAAGEAELHRQTLTRLADFLSAQRESVTDQWLMAVRRSPEIETAHKLTHQQLLDHLPEIYQECCNFIRTRDAAVLLGDAQSDAKTHGEVRWADGYEIEELLRELEIFRNILTGMVLRFSDTEPRFRGPLVAAVATSLQQFFGEVTVHSVAQYTSEQQRVVKAYTDQIEAANLELSRANNNLEQALSERQRLLAIVVHEVRSFLQTARGESSASEARSSLPQTPGATTPLQDATHPLEQLLEHASLIVHREHLSYTPVDLTSLHAEILQIYRPLAYAKGLALVGSCTKAPQQVVADRRRLKQVACNLLSNAIRWTGEGHVSLTFSTKDAQRWTMQVADSGPGLDEDACRLLLGTQLDDTQLARPAIGLAITKDLVGLLGGSIQVITKAGAGTVVEVVLPIDSTSEQDGTR